MQLGAIESHQCYDKIKFDMCFKPLMLIVHNQLQIMSVAMHAYVMQDMSRFQQAELNINAKNVLPGASKRSWKMPVQNAVQARTVLLTSQ